MTPHEWRSVQDEVAQLWGPSQKWRQAHALTSRVSHIPLSAAMAAVTEFVGQRYSPAPADIIGAAQAQLAPLKVTTRPGPEDCDHPQWCIIEYRDDSSRVGLCRVCRVERLFQPGRLLMQWEVEERRLKSQEAKVF